MRKLATIEQIHSTRPIPDADAIEVVRVRGWDVVAKIGDFQPGDPCVYFEIDSLIPIDQDRYQFLANRGVRTDVNGNTGHVLRTMKLRGQYSLGLVLPLDVFPELAADTPVGTDVSDLLGIIKWDPPVPPEMEGAVVGPFPSWTRQTDAERVQNLADMFPLDPPGWTATEKIDGMAATFSFDPEGNPTVSTKTWSMAYNPDHTMWRLADQLGVFDLLRSVSAQLDPLVNEFGPVVLQGELYGEKIQRNPLKMRGHHLAFYGGLVGQQRMGFSDVASLFPELPFVPIVNLPVPTSIDDALAQVEGMESLVSPGHQAEGVVWSHPSFDPWKAINNRFLSKQKD
jgi:RNA ligase (TIGR02306 family)